MMAKKKTSDSQVLAKNFNMQIVSNLLNYKFVKEKKQIIPYSFAKKHFVIPIDEDSFHVTVAISDPLNIDILTELEMLFQKKVSLVFCRAEKIQEAIEKCYEQKFEDTKQLIDSLHKEKKQLKKRKDGFDLLERTDKNPVIQLLNAILLEAIQQAASDIHFDPQEDGLKIRFRIDGVLLERHSPSVKYQSQILTRIKVMAKLDIAEQRLPQDGRIKLNIGEREIDFRVSTVPTVFGERIVLRILDKSNVLLGLNKLGMKKEILSAFRSLINISEGIVLVTGPTGSGKTTTLYSAISEINSSEKNIMTIEDPVEYKLPSIAQIHVNPKINLNFSTGLRHILRQDPDSIMIGEIRDSETAEIAIQAALTGHLVLSTLHTNDAPSAITRLADMGIEPYLLASSILGVLAQRLVRKICPNCKTPYEPTERELDMLPFEKDELIDGKLFYGKGCDKCFNTGYSGRHGIFELMIMSPAVKKTVMQTVDCNTIKDVATEEHMDELHISGAELIRDGITTISEVMRVTDIVVNNT